MAIARPVYPRWFWLAVSLSAFVASPLLFLLIRLASPPGAKWELISRNLLGDYAINTLGVLGIALPLTAAMGIASAWLMAFYDFRARKWLEVLFILPLTIPAYLMAISQSQIFGYGGLIPSWFGHLGAEGVKNVDIMNLPGLAIVYSLALYPYVYIPVRLALQGNLSGILEASRSLGSSSSKVFFRIALPLCRPAIAGGLLLAAMEILNDYGAAKYFGINTFSTGIFTSWFSLKDLPSAIRLSGILLLVVAAILLGERLLRGKASFAGAPAKPASRKVAGPLTLAFTLMLIILLPGLGFILPMAQIIPDAISNWEAITEPGFSTMAFRSFLLAFAGATAIVLIAYGILFARRINKSRLLQTVSSASALGYAVPGAVLAVAVGYFSNEIDRLLGLQVLAASAGAIVFAYMVRFMAIGYNTIDSGMEGIHRRTEMAAFSLGQSPWKTLRRVNFPISRNLLAGVFILCFVDIVKELPLTYILRPFNFNTFATKTFDYASDEMLAKASVPALFIILLSLIPVVYLVRKMRRS